MTETGVETIAVLEGTEQSVPTSRPYPVPVEGIHPLPTVPDASG